MPVRTFCLVVAAAVAALSALWPTDAAARTCYFDWAVPGQYTITGNFRGPNESAVANLSPSCRVHLMIPGVFSGTPVQRTGECLTFPFRVEGVAEPFTATWCKGEAFVPWQGRNVPAKVWQSRRQRGS